MQVVKIGFLADSLLGAKSMVGVVGPGTARASQIFFKACIERDLQKAVPLHVKFSELFQDITGQNEVAWLKACAEFGGLQQSSKEALYSPR